MRTHDNARVNGGCRSGKPPVHLGSVKRMADRGVGGRWAECRNPSLRPHAKRLQPRGSWGWPHRLQPSAAGFGPPLWLPAEGMQAVQGQDAGRGRAALSLHPRGLLARSQLPQSRRPQSATAAVARPGASSPSTSPKCAPDNVSRQRRAEALKRW